MEFNPDEFIALIRMNNIQGVLRKVQHETYELSKEQARVCTE